MYDPSIGKFISEDPIGFEAGDVNLTRYVDNNPMMETDPDGLQARDEEVHFRFNPREVRFDFIPYNPAVYNPRVTYRATREDILPTLELMVLLGGIPGDMAWAFTTQPSEHGDAQQVEMTYGSTSAQSTIKGRKPPVLRLENHPSFSSPNVSGENLITVQRKIDANITRRYITVAHELGHRMIGVDDPLQSSSYAGASLVIENIARQFIQMYNLHNEPLPSNSSMTTIYSLRIYSRLNYAAGTPRAPKDTSELEWIIKNQRQFPTKQKFAQAELNKLNKEIPILHGKIPPEVMNLRRAFLNSVLDRVEERLRWVANPNGQFPKNMKSSVQMARQHHFAIAFQILSLMKNLYSRGDYPAIHRRIADIATS